MNKYPRQKLVLRHSLKAAPGFSFPCFLDSLNRNAQLQLVYNRSMARKAARLEDIGDERDQAVFLATVKLWQGGDL